MKPFVRHTGIAAPLLRDNVDTDSIIPSREIKRISKNGLAAGLFANWRYLAPSAREPAPDFVLNIPSYRGASILLCGANFGCGSSREHAVWALREYGIRTIIASSFGHIFQDNCIINGLLPIVLEEGSIRNLAAQVEAEPAKHMLAIDLEKSTVIAPDSTVYEFAIAAGQRQMLLQGLEPIDLTLQKQEQIDAFLHADRQQRPWAYAPLEKNRQHREK